MISRRQFVQSAGLAGLWLLAGCDRLPGQTQQAQRAARLGYISPNTLEAEQSFSQVLLQGLHELDWIEGQNITVEYRHAEGRIERLPDLAADLTRLGVDVIFARTSPAAVAAKQATESIPIVFADVGDPLGLGLVSSLAQPGGNVTGASPIASQLSAKRLQLLKEAAPRVSRVGVFWSPNNPANAREWTETQAAGDALGVDVQSLQIRSADDLRGAFEAAVRSGADSLFVLSGPVVGEHGGQIADFAAGGGLPTMYTTRDRVDSGGLMSYSVSAHGRYGRAAYYVDRILKGTKPVDLPVEQPREFDFVINLQTAQVLGLTIPQHVLLQATEVIQ